MTDRALVAASIAAAIAYPLVEGGALPAAIEIALKGAGVGLLALAAASHARTLDGWLLAAVMAFGALGDVLLEIAFLLGVAAFGFGHLTAIALYLRNRRPRGSVTPSQWLLAVALVAFGLVMPSLIFPRGADGVAPLTAYSTLLAAMAAATWLSRYPRYRTGLGAVLFLASDTLIAARMAAPVGFGATLATWLVWPLYYAGQLLIYLGVSRSPPLPCRGGVSITLRSP